MKKQGLSFLLLLFIVATAQGQIVADSTLFDFWVGHWNASWKNPDGTTGTGTNRIMKILDGKVIQENFEDHNGLKGNSISVFNAKTKKWHQAWADNQNGYFDFEGGADGSRRFFQTKMVERKDKKIIQRMVFYDIKPNSFNWDWESTTDGGTTWALNWRINYVRSPQPSSAPSASAVSELSSTDSVFNTSYQANNGERFQRLEIVVDKSLKVVWKEFSTEAGIKSWLAPVVKLDFKIGGNELTHYDASAKIGDKGTISLGIMNYVQYELITYRINLNEKFSEKCRAEDDNLQELIQFTPLSPHKTKLSMTMMGWGVGNEWDKTYQFFEMGNTWTARQIIQRFKSGPLTWK